MHLPVVYACAVYVKSTGEPQSANYLKSRTDYTSECQLVNYAKQENDRRTQSCVEEEFTFEN
jgi:hypothetical protein